MIDVTNKAVDFSQYITYWTGPANQTHNTVIEITFFFAIPILVNILNVRKYGEVEFWLTAIKVEVIVTIIIVGFVIAAGGGPTKLLGTDPNTYQVVPCSAALLVQGNCTSQPGFNRMHPIFDFLTLSLVHCSIFAMDAEWVGRKAFAILGMFYLSGLLIFRK